MTQWPIGTIRPVLSATAIADDEFGVAVLLGPVVVEALLRWEHPQRGLLPTRWQPLNVACRGINQGSLIQLAAMTAASGAAKPGDGRCGRRGFARPSVPDDVRGRHPAGGGSTGPERGVVVASRGRRQGCGEGYGTEGDGEQHEQHTNREQANGCGHGYLQAGDVAYND